MLISAGTAGLTVLRLESAREHFQMKLTEAVIVIILDN